MTTILQHTDPILRETAQALDPERLPDAEVNETIAAMRTALEAEEDGVALAAPQIGHSIRLFVISHRAFKLYDEERGKPMRGDHTDRVYINPEITSRSKKNATLIEGCLSVRWWYGDTTRPEKIGVRAYDAEGNVFEHGAGGLLAQIIQHEIEHLNGILFFDHARNVHEIDPAELEHAHATPTTTEERS